jgi:hypothetical protein
MIKFINKWYGKNKNKLPGIAFIIIFTYIATKLLDAATTWAGHNGSQSLIKVLNTKIDIPITPLVIGAAILYSILSYRLKNSIKSRKLKIIKARYGVNDSYVDITEELNKAVIDNKLAILISNEIAGDPFPGTRKVATVHYEYDNKKRNINKNESEVLVLPNL